MYIQMTVSNIYVILHNGEEIYVGFSKDIIERWRVYKCAYGNSNLLAHKEKVTQYMVKHGWYNHSIQLVEANVCTIGMRARLAYWVTAYELIGCTMLNSVNINVDRKDACYYTVVCKRCSSSVKNTDMSRHHKTNKCLLLSKGFANRQG